MAQFVGGYENWQAPFNWDDFPFEEVKILIFGKEKQGKSSLGNLILGAQLLDVNPQPGEDAEPWSCACQHVYGKPITVVDIPGHIPKAVEVMFSKTPLFPGPHVLLYVVDGTARFTRQDKEHFENFLKMFDKKVFKHVILVTTHSDEIEDNEESYIQNIVNNNKYLKAVFSGCEERHLFINSFPQTPSEDGHMIENQQHLVLKDVSSLVKARKTVITSEIILDKIIKQNDKLLPGLVRYLLNADKQLLFWYRKKHGGRRSDEIHDRLKNFPSEEMQENFNVLRDVKTMLDKRHDAVALDTEIEEVATVISQHIDLLGKYDITGDTTEDSASTLLPTLAVVMAFTSVVAFILFGRN